MTVQDIQAEPVGGRLWIVSAPSGAGKTSLTRALVRRLNHEGIAAAISVSYTTRVPRAGEVHRQHYHFVDPQTFSAMVSDGEFLEHADVFGRRYGTGRAETGRLLEQGCQLFLDIDWQGARQLRERVDDACSVFILPPSAEELERRLRGRGQDAESVIAERMQAARDEMSHYAEYEFLLVNDTFEHALDQMHALVMTEYLRTPAQARRQAGLLSALLD